MDPEKHAHCGPGGEGAVRRAVDRGHGRELTIGTQLPPLWQVAVRSGRGGRLRLQTASPGCVHTRRTGSSPPLCKDADSAHQGPTSDVIGLGLGFRQGNSGAPTGTQGIACSSVSNGHPGG